MEGAIAGKLLATGYSLFFVFFCFFVFFSRTFLTRGKFDDEGPCADAPYIAAPSAAVVGHSPLCCIPARLGEEFVQLGLWAFSELGSGRELKERGSKGALGCDSQEPGPARNPSGDRGRSRCGRDRRRFMSREQAQELHGLSAKPAANLDTDNDEAAPPCPGEFWVGVVSLPVRGGRDSAGLAEPRKGRHDSGIEGELGPVPEGETVRDNFDAPRVSDRHIDIHVCEADVAGNPGASLPADSRNGVL